MAESNSTISLAELLRRRSEDAAFEHKPTRIEGRSLLVEKGTNPELTRRDLGKFATAAWRYGRKKTKIDKLQGEQDIIRDSMIDFAQQHEGVRGIAHVIRKFRRTVFPVRDVTYHRWGLRAGLEVAYPAVVSEDLHVGMTIPLGHPTEQGPLSPEIADAAFKLGLTTLGFSEAQIDKMYTSRIELRVDEQKLHEMNQAGQVVLTDNMATIKETWTVR